MKGELVAPARSRIVLDDGNLRFDQPFDLDFGNYSMGLVENSWLDTGTLEHEFHGGISISEKFTGETRAGVERFLRDKAGDTAADIGVDIILNPLVEAGRMTLRFGSSGPLGEPDVSLDNELGDIEDVMEEVGKKLIRGKGGLDSLLKGILD